MSFSKEKLSHRTLRIIKHQRGNRTFFTISPLDSVLTKDGQSYFTGTPTSDDFVLKMGSLEYDTIEYIEEPRVSRKPLASMNDLIMYSPDVSVGRTS